MSKLKDKIFDIDYEELRNLFHRRLKNHAINIGWDNPYSMFITCEVEEESTIKKILKEENFDQPVKIKTRKRNLKI